MICAGIDAGSRAIKVVLLDAHSLELKAAGVTDQGIEQNALALKLLESLRLKAAGVADQGGEQEALRLNVRESLSQSSTVRRGDICGIVATGYGRKLITLADAAVTEITCQAWGVRHRVPDARTIIDIGGQDSKLVRLSAEGKVADFVMNDRCAAGTGRFLEVVATRLGVKLPRLGEMAARSRSAAVISSMCVVFAETEITGLLASGTAAEEIAAGVQASIAVRMAAMAGSDLPPPILFTGGVALVPGMAAALESALKTPVAIAPDPQMTGALGAAILASRRLGDLHATAR